MQEQDNQHMDDIIRSSFEKRSKGAPDSLWGNLSSALDADQTGSVEEPLSLDPLDRKIKESFSSLNERAPRHVWPAINRQLNIDKVWQGISNELGKSQPFYWPGMRRMAAAILLLLLSGAGAYVVLNSGTESLPLAQSSEPVATELNVPAVVEESTADVALTDNKLQRQQANADNTIKLEAPVSSTRKGSLNKGLVAAEKGNTTLVGTTFKDAQAANSTVAIESASTLPITEEAIASIEDTAIPPRIKEVSEVPGAGEAAEGKALSRVGTTDANAKAAHTFSEAESVTSTLSRAQASSTALASPGDKKSRVEAELQPAAPTVSDNETALGSKETKTALSSSESVGIVPEDAQALARLEPYFIESLPSTLEENGGMIDVEVMPVDTAIAQQEILAQLIKEAAEKQLNDKKFEAGPVMVYNNSWLLNNETKSSYNKNSLIATDPTYKQNWGLVLNYYLGRKSLVASEVHISRTGQQYKMYQQGEYLKRDLELRYYKLYLQYQYNFLEYGKTLPSWLTVKAGAYGGYLYEKQGELRTEKSKYARLDYGVRLALGQETKVGKLIIGYGLSAERGLNNVFRGTENLPAEFNKTYLLNVGSYINLRYAF